MAQARQHAVAEGRRRAAAHHVMGESRCGAEGRGDQASNRDVRIADSWHFSLAASLARCARLDIPCPAPDKPQPNEPEPPCPTTSLPTSSTTPSRSATRSARRPRAPVRKAVECRARPARQRRGARRRARGRRPLAGQSVAEEGGAAVVPPQRHERHPGRARQGGVVGQGAFEVRRLERRAIPQGRLSRGARLRGAPLGLSSRPASC